MFEWVSGGVGDGLIYWSMHSGCLLSLKMIYNFQLDLSNYGISVLIFSVQSRQFALSLHCRLDHVVVPPIVLSLTHFKA